MIRWRTLIGPAVAVPALLVMACSSESENGLGDGAWPPIPTFTAVAPSSPTDGVWQTSHLLNVNGSAMRDGLIVRALEPTESGKLLSAFELPSGGAIYGLSGVVANGAGKVEAGWTIAAVDRFVSFGGVRAAGNHLIVGVNDNDPTKPSNTHGFAVLELDEAGTVVRNHRFQSGGFNRMPTGLRLKDGGDLVLVGDLLVRLDANGLVAWAKQYATSARETALAADAVEIQDGLLVSFLPNQTAIATDPILIARLDAGGQVVWSKTFGLREGQHTTSNMVVGEDGNVRLCSAIWRREGAPAALVTIAPDGSGAVGSEVDLSVEGERVPYTMGLAHELRRTSSGGWLCTISATKGPNGVGDQKEHPLAMYFAPDDRLERVEISPGAKHPAMLSDGTAAFVESDPGSRSFVLRRPRHAEACVTPIVGRLSTARPLESKVVSITAKSVSIAATAPLNLRSLPTSVSSSMETGCWSRGYR